MDRPDQSGWALRIESTRFVINDREHPNKKPTAGPNGIAAFDEFCA